MHLKLMFITNDPQTARIAQAAGVDRIFVDMEALGKAERQGGMDTVQSHHTAADAARLRPLLDRAELLVRVDPIHDGSQEQIEAVLRAGADVVMLPFFHTAEEVAAFTRIVGGRARTCLLVETPEAVERIDEILAVPGVDECHIGLNDLHLGYRLPFLFQLLADGTVERLCGKFRAAGKPYGFGGFGRPGTGQLPAERIMGEHCRLGSSLAILSRTFCDLRQRRTAAETETLFREGVGDIRRWEERLSKASPEELEANRREVCRRVDEIVKELERK